MLNERIRSLAGSTHIILLLQKTYNNDVEFTSYLKENIVVIMLHRKYPPHDLTYVFLLLQVNYSQETN